MTDNEPLVGEPTSPGDRGFLLYGGRAINTSYGHRVRVMESSSASGPHVWLFIDPPGGDGTREPHLSLAEAIALRTALDQFIESVPERWNDGQDKLDEARRIAIGEA